MKTHLWTYQSRTGWRRKRRGKCFLREEKKKTGWVYILWHPGRFGTVSRPRLARLLLSAGASDHYQQPLGWTTTKNRSKIFYFGPKFHFHFPIGKEFIDSFDVFLRVSIHWLCGWQKVGNFMDDFEQNSVTWTNVEPPNQPHPLWFNSAAAGSLAGSNCTQKTFDRKFKGLSNGF